MLRSLKALEHYSVAATDGDIGRVVDFLVDDESWTVRYFVAGTGKLLGGRSVLISPRSFERADWSTKAFHVALSVDRVKHAPGIDTDQSVSRQHETEQGDSYAFPSYWGLAGVWGIEAYPLSSHVLGRSLVGAAPARPPGDSHLRSASELRGYGVQGIDGEIGHVADFIVDDVSWEVRYLVIDTSNWWFGKHVLIVPHWASRVSWSERKVFFDRTLWQIRNSPLWDSHSPINREYEARLYDFYGRPVYWARGHKKPGPATPHAQ